MNNFKLNSDIIFTIDVEGISVVNKTDHTHLFIRYPEAAVWCILTKNYNKPKSVQMLQPILGINETDTEKYIRKCMKNWKQLNMIL